MESNAIAAPDAQYRHWQRTRRLTLLLLLLWFGSTFSLIFFARELSTIHFFGWPLSFYLAAQGIVILYTAIIAIYAYKMRAIDTQYEQANDKPT